MSSLSCQHNICMMKLEVYALIEGTGVSKQERLRGGATLGPELVRGDQVPLCNLTTSLLQPITGYVLRGDHHGGSTVLAWRASFLHTHHNLCHILTWGNLVCCLA